MTTDVRVLAAEAEQHARRRLRRRALPGTVLVLVLAAALAVAAVSDPGNAGLGAGAAWLLALALPILAATVLRHPRRAAAVRESAVAGLPASVLRRPAGGWWAGFGVLAAVALLPAGGAVAAAADGDGGWAVVLALVALLLGAPVLAALAGRYVPGELALTPVGLRYRHLGLESSVAWDDVEQVQVDETAREVALVVGRGAARHRYRAGVLRGQRAVHDAVVELRLREWGVRPTDVGRLLLHHAATPADRAELGTPAARERWEQIGGLPVERRRASWRVGRDSGLRRFALDEQDVATPVWRDTAEDAVATSMLESYRLRGIFGGGLLALGLVLAALTQLPQPVGLVTALGLAVAGGAVMMLVFGSPRRPALGRARGRGAVDRLDGVVLRRAPRRHRLTAAAWAGAGVALGAVVVHTAGAWPVGMSVGAGAASAAMLVPAVLLATGRSSPGELVLTEEDLAYRSGRTAFVVGWHEVARVDAMWEDVVRLERHDGTVLRLDVAGMPSGHSSVVALLAGYVRRGGPRGDTRDVEAVRLRLGPGRGL